MKKKLPDLEKEGNSTKAFRLSYKEVLFPADYYISIFPYIFSFAI